MSEALQEIEKAAAEGLPPEELIARLEALHEKVYSDEEQRIEFERDVIKVANGIYIPHIFWIYLSAFIGDKDAYRPFLEYILQVYAQFPPHPLVDKRMRILLCVYFQEESRFYLDKLEDYLRKRSHPEKYKLIKDAQEFTNRNPRTSDIFRQKFYLLRDYSPNFELISTPLPHLRETLRQMTQTL
ncbi:MAG: hypothetical protein RMK19_05635 [Bacteroidia bacterium]|nr:hypothetical protein [Bacteroidia bacterium]MDW8015476.1 hypothetical protein [Bacteroidia bacterium]